jgi:SAM-dependent methyltransferase
MTRGPRSVALPQLIVDTATGQAVNVVFVPTPIEVVETMLLLAEVKPGDILYDLGCGDGRIPILAAQRFGARAVGIEIQRDMLDAAISNRGLSHCAHQQGHSAEMHSLLFAPNIDNREKMHWRVRATATTRMNRGLFDRCVASSTGMSEHEELGGVSFRYQDMFAADIRDATVVTLYLLQRLNVKLRSTLLRDVKPGTRVVSHSFDMGDDWKPHKTAFVRGKPIYLWKVAAD